MSTKSLARPIDNVLDVHETRVVAIIDHLAPVLASWRQGEDLRHEKDTLETQCDALEGEILKLKPVGVQLSADLASVQKKVSTFLFVAAALLVGGVGLFFATSAGIVLAVVAGYPFWKWLQLKKQAAALADELTQNQQALAQADAGLRQALARLEVIEKELELRVGGFPEITLADVHLPLESLDLAGHQVLNDRSGSHAPVHLSTIDMTALTDEVSAITGQLQSLLDIPPMLSAEDVTDSSDPMNSLYGEENQLQSLVGDFTNNLAKLHDVGIDMHLVPASSLLQQRLSNGEFQDVMSPTACEAAASGSDAPEIETFTKTINVLSSTSGQHLLDTLNTVYEGLEGTCNRFANARIASVNQIHGGLTQVLERASWCSRKFFCPRTIVSPHYIQDLIGVQIESAHMLDIHILLDRLQSDEVVRARISKKPDLLEDLSAAHQTVGLFLQMMAVDENGNTLHDQAIKPRHVQMQIDDALKVFRLVLNKILTGASNPIIHFSQEAQLRYDPDLDEWSTDLAAYVYRTPDAIKYGSVVKTHCDLMIPLWDHLWTEKADFRKSELFRTNEMMISMSEKEGEKLISVANQFRDDLRTNRENLYLLESDLNAKYDEILSFRDGMSALGLLSPRVMEQITDERLQRLLIGESPLSAANTYENTLASLPKAQGLTRGSVHDPIEVVREPGIMLSTPRVGGPRLISP